MPETESDKGQKFKACNVMRGYCRYYHARVGTTDLGRPSSCARRRVPRSAHSSRAIRSIFLCGLLMLYNSPSIRPPDRTRPMSHLARKLRLTDYFTLAWGTMVGVGWLVVMDDWLCAAALWARCSASPSAARCCSRSAGSTVGSSPPCQMPRAKSPTLPQLFPSRQLLHRMDDDARLLHRLPVGSRGRWPHRRLHRSCARFDRNLSHRRTSGLSSAPHHRSRPHGSAHHAELSRRPPQRHFSELDFLRHARPVHRLRRARRQAKDRRATFRRSSLTRRWFRFCSCFRSSHIS
jgi:hypothetical protein